MKKQAVVIVNLGTPDEPTPKAVRTYLRQFLGDPRVIDKPRIMWLPILYCMILPNRPKKSAALYRQIWTESGSPLLIHTKRQAEQLQELLPDIDVHYAMSYSTPTVSDVLTMLEAKGTECVTILPLYPQYSTTTVGSIFDDVMRYYLTRPKLPELHFIHDYCDDPDYLDALATKIQDKLSEADYDLLLFSYHGIPQSYVTKGDCYPDQCTATTDGVMARLTTKIEHLQSYQSKFGPDPWLLPATDATVKSLPNKGYKKVLVVTPSFVSDCLETLQEIEVENKEFFMEAGGQRFDIVKPFNDDLDFVKVLAQLTDRK